MSKKIKSKNPRLKEIEKKEKQDGIKTGLKKEDLVPLPKNTVVEERRVGCFHVHTSMYDVMPWNVCRQFVKHFIVIRCVMVPNQPILEYTAFSPLFEKVSPLEQDKKAPLYQVNIKGAKGKITVSAKKLEERKIIAPGDHSLTLNLAPGPVNRR